MTSITLGRARHNMETAKISAATLAKLTDLAPSTLSAAFRSVVYLGSETEARLLRMSIRVLELQEALRPLREPTDVGDLRRLLDFIEERNISADKIRETVSSLFE